MQKKEAELATWYKKLEESIANADKEDSAKKAVPPLVSNLSDYKKAHALKKADQAKTAEDLGIHRKNSSAAFKSTMHAEVVEGMNQKPKVMRVEVAKAGLEATGMSPAGPVQSLQSSSSSSQNVSIN